jgi:hypothetical protein
MASRSLAAAAVLTLLPAAYGCSNDDDADSATAATTVAITDAGMEVDVPRGLADLTYAMGESEEGQPAVYFSTEELTRIGGPSCAAGATAAVSPYPLGQVVVSDETPEHVREEAKENPQESLGRYIKQVSGTYLFYIAPPVESCAAGNRRASRLQRQLTVELKPALKTLRSR